MGKKIEIPIDGKTFRYLCMRLDKRAEDLAFELGFSSGRIDAVLAKGRLTGPVLACLAYICRYHNLDIVKLLEEARSVLTINEFASECRVSVTTVRRWIRAGRVKLIANEAFYFFIH